MADLLIRDVPDEVVAALDANAKRLGLSRSEYLRRRLAGEGAELGEAVTVDDLVTFADTFTDLREPEVMARAWQ
ncbi:MAG: type II toxin-antitoxin system VapB family antitoxin [Egibacteraceae bacterium]